MKAILIITMLVAISSSQIVGGWKDLDPKSVMNDVEIKNVVNFAMEAKGGEYHGVSFKIEEIVKVET